MTEVRQKSFSDQRVDLDNKRFTQCRFERCELVFSGGAVGLVQCMFNGCRWTFAGAAAATLGFMAAMYHMEGDGSGRKTVEDTFANIRAKNNPPG